MYSEIYRKFTECAVEKCGLRKDRAQHIVAAVSGGADSVCMLMLLIEYYGRDRLACAHFNHKIRGAESERDVHFVETLANRLHVKFFCGEGDVPQYAKTHAIGVEEAARTLRYAFLRKLAADIGANTRIAVAHNRNDRMETILHNIARGTAIDGLKGIEYHKNDIIRPILDLSRKETEEICAHYGIQPIYDSTNKDNRYTRNKIRNEVLPYLKGVFGKNFEEHLLNLSKSATVDSAYLNLSARDAYQKICKVTTKPFHKIILDRAQYKKLHEALQKRLVRYILSNVKDRDGNRIFPEFTGIYSDMIERVCAMADQSLPGKVLELPSGVLCVTEYESLIFLHKSLLEERRSENISPDHFEVEEKVLSNEEILLQIKKKSSKEEIFDADVLSKKFGADFQIEFRRNREGDHFIPFGSPGGKSLRKFFIDRKIGRLERDFIIVAAIGAEVLWIPEIRRSGIAPIDKNTTRVIILRHISQTEVYE
jgi:tRNA(ile)-lysidine synthase